MEIIFQMKQLELSITEADEYSVDHEHAIIIQGLRTKLRFEDNQREMLINASVDSFMIKCIDQQEITLLHRVVSSPFYDKLEDNPQMYDYFTEEQLGNLKAVGDEKDLYLEYHTLTSKIYDPQDFDDIIMESKEEVFCIINQNRFVLNIQQIKLTLELYNKIMALLYDSTKNYNAKISKEKADMIQLLKETKRFKHTRSNMLLEKILKNFKTQLPQKMN